ncbi:PREDICTED: kanadaptin [Drosophila arizonae]|uniref:Kanadaptin n=1 Tax=Drosophila arizonae TaxID=7263 RepID=A0ABM1Q3Y8_DROAR|nr:PREDICTED: kanadaptin [Drosophila arizonae]
MDDFKVPVLPPAPSTKSESAVEEPYPEAAKVQPATGCPYKVPKWSQPPNDGQDYRFEVLKSGQIIDEVKQLQQQAYWTFGRLPDNDVAMAHPTISRYHAVLQYKPKASDGEDEEAAQPAGWYIYDLGSTHGTFLNKQRVPPRVYIRIRVGHMLKMGSSTRVYILQGPGEDEEPESEQTVTELREQREQQVAAAMAERERKALEAEERERNEGASWGMGEDADEETDLTHNPYASTNNEDLFFDDPKRTLRGFFEREGLNLEYKCDELAQGSFVCRVELPIDDSNGRAIVVEVTHKGRKKDCVVQCALEACRTLDRHGVLRQANQESQKRKQLKAKGDSDDEDEFWDRTGDVARKKQRLANANVSVTLTYDDLLKQQNELDAELAKVELEIGAYQQNEKRLKAQAVQQQSASDDLDNFMDTLNENVTQLDKTEIKKLRLEQQRIKSEQQKLQRLIKIAKPTALPFDTPSNNAQKVEANVAKKQLPMIGKRNQFSKFKIVKAQPIASSKAKVNAFADDEEVEEEDEEEETEKKQIQKQEHQEKEKETPEEKTEEEKEKEKLNKQKQPLQLVMGERQELLPEETELEQQAQQFKQKSDANKLEVNNESDEATAITEAAAELATAPIDAASETAEGERKRRQRQRQRTNHSNNNKLRSDVDMDLNELAEHEDSEKYAKWIPPTNQSGDGFTHLNEKFGY